MEKGDTKQVRRGDSLTRTCSVKGEWVYKSKRGMGQNSIILSKGGGGGSYILSKKEWRTLVLITIGFERLTYYSLITNIFSRNLSSKLAEEISKPLKILVDTQNKARKPVCKVKPELEKSILR